MKRADLKDRSSVFLIGRGFIIATALIISSLSFALGYFVGKSAQPPVEGRTSIIAQEEAVAQQPEQMKGTQEAQRTKETLKIRETTKTKKYTVQVGAFKNASDADALKAELDKEGYRTYITRSETKKDGDLYKVRIGEFDTRKEAEVLSIKIKNRQGLQTFVTLK